jgi:hypothetical protein
MLNKAIHTATIRNHRATTWNDAFIKGPGLQYLKYVIAKRAVLIIGVIGGLHISAQYYGYKSIQNSFSICIVNTL